MEAVFSLPYPEYVVAEEVRTHLRKAKGYAVCIPLSRQQKGMDLLVHNMKTRRSATIQVKSSRAYLGRPKRTDPPEGPFDYYLWFNAFDPSESPADFYAFVGIFPKKSMLRHSFGRRRSPRSWWSHIVLLLPYTEVLRLMHTIRRKRDRFFYVGFDIDLKRVALARVTTHPRPWQHHLLDESVVQLEHSLAARGVRRAKN
jgi:hypothetical protein